MVPPQSATVWTAGSLGRELGCAETARGGLVLGVCNGFQILTEAGLLPGALMRNAGLKFVCKKVRLSVENDSTFFTRSMSKGDVVTCPLHNWKIDLASGEALGPDEGCTNTFATRVENGVVYLALSANEAAA